MEYLYIGLGTTAVVLYVMYQMYKDDYEDFFKFWEFYVLLIKSQMVCWRYRKGYLFYVAVILI